MNHYVLRSHSINLFAFLFLATLLSMMGYNAYNLDALRFASYAAECIMIVYTFIVSMGGNRGLTISNSVVGISIIVLLNYIFSPNEPDYTDLIKYIGYYGCFIYGSFLAGRYESLKIHRILLYSIILIPAILVTFFDSTILKNSFFRTPNGFVYTGVAIGAFYLLVKGREKKYFIRAVIISAFYVLICTSLGVVVAAFLAFLLLNLKKSHLPYLFAGVAILLAAVFFIDIPLFLRVRDVFSVWSYVYNSNLNSIQDVDFVELNQLDREGERTDTASSVWRIVHWMNIFTLYVKQIWTIPFGMGAGFSLKETGLYPHNDYLRILSEYGLIVFGFFMSFVIRVYKNLRTEGMLIYFILTMLLYHFTENLLNNFPPGAILYFVIGWSLRKCEINKRIAVI